MTKISSGICRGAVKFRSLRALIWQLHWPTCHVQGWGLLSQFPLFRYFPKIFFAVKTHFNVKYGVHIWQVSPQLGCGDTCQIWMWFEESNIYFCEIENFAYGEINERSFSNPHPRTDNTPQLWIWKFQTNRMTSNPLFSDSHIGYFLFNLCWFYFSKQHMCVFSIVYLHWDKAVAWYPQIIHTMMTSSNGNIFSRYWSFVWGFHRSPVNSPHKAQWRGGLMFSLICAWVNNREAGDLRRHHAHYDVTVIT